MKQNNQASTRWLSQEKIFGAIQTEICDGWLFTFYVSYTDKHLESTESY